MQSLYRRQGINSWTIENSRLGENKFLKQFRGRKSGSEVLAKRQKFLGISRGLIVGKNWTRYLFQ